MNSTQRVRNAILGNPVDRTPIYGWVEANLSKEISEEFGSVAAFEDHYEFDMAHIFGGPSFCNWSVRDRLRDANDELTPDLILDAPDFFGDVDDEAAEIARIKKRYEARLQRVFA